ncbi:MAG: winged helix-turn-helix domain-containing protein [Chromatiales bacterium]|nr:winged helix-turn-helix domain-containing protein [Chromatiales bacterium]
MVPDLARRRGRPRSRSGAAGATTTSPSRSACANWWRACAAILQDAGVPRRQPAATCRWCTAGCASTLSSSEGWWDGRELVLTVTEFGLLRTLMRRPGKVFTRRRADERRLRPRTTWSATAPSTAVRRLRAKLAAAGGDPVETVHGLGYKLGAC